MVFATGAAIIRHTNEFDAIVFSLYDRLEVDTDRIIRDGFPTSAPERKLSYLNFELKQGRRSHACNAWKVISGDGLSIDGVHANIAKLACGE